MEGQPLTLEQLVNDATDVNNFCSNDAQAQAVANCVNRTINGSPLAIKLLTQKLRTRKEIVMLQTLNVFEICAKKCGSKFHKEIGKFRFLNEFIKLLSTKYEGNSTPENVKERVIDILYSWYVNLPNETKIHEAYKVLKHEGIVTQDPVSIKKGKTGKNDASSIHADDFDVDKEDSTPFNDEDKSQLLKHLLSSTNAEDLDSANQLIKTMVKEEEKRLDGVTKKFQLLEVVKNNVSLLHDMLVNYDAETAGDSLQIINELYEKCVSLRPDLYRLASKNIDEENDTVAEILTSSDDLTQVIDFYRDVIILNKKGGKNTTVASVIDDSVAAELSGNSSSLLDMNTSQPCEASSGDLQNPLLDEQLKLLGLSSGASVPDASSDYPEEFTPMQSELSVSTDEALMFGTSSSSLHSSVQSSFGSLSSSSNMLHLNNNMSSQLVFPNSFSCPVNPAVNSRSYVQIPNIPTNTPSESETALLEKKDVLDFDVFSSEFFTKPSKKENIEVATDVLEDDDGGATGGSGMLCNNNLPDHLLASVTVSNTISSDSANQCTESDLPKLPELTPVETAKLLESTTKLLEATPAELLILSVEDLPSLACGKLPETKPKTTEILQAATTIQELTLPRTLPLLAPGELPVVKSIETTDELEPTLVEQFLPLPRNLPTLSPVELSAEKPVHTTDRQETLGQVPQLPRKLPSLVTGELLHTKPVEITELQETNPAEQQPLLPRTLPSLNPTELTQAKEVETLEQMEITPFELSSLLPRALPALLPAESPVEVPFEATGPLEKMSAELSSLLPRTLPSLTDSKPMETTSLPETITAELSAQLPIILPSIDCTESIVSKHVEVEVTELLETIPGNISSLSPRILPSLVPAESSEAESAEAIEVERIPAESPETLPSLTSTEVHPAVPSETTISTATIPSPLLITDSTVSATQVNSHTPCGVDAPHGQTSVTNYTVPLEALKTDKYAPIRVLDKDGLKTFLIIGEDTREIANAKVIVGVLSTLSLNMQPLSNFTIQVACPKAMRVKLQAATSTELSPFNPLLPPPTISQILLIANPNCEVVKLRFKINYTLGGVGCVETINIDNFPVR